MGVGASYSHRHYHRPVLTGVTFEGATEDEDVGIYGSVSRSLSHLVGRVRRLCELVRHRLANETGDGVRRSATAALMLERLHLAALGIDHSDDDTISSTTARRRPASGTPLTGAPAGESYVHRSLRPQRALS
jgi:hypothetical protein